MEVLSLKFINCVRNSLKRVEGFHYARHYQQLAEKMKVKLPKGSRRLVLEADPVGLRLLTKLPKGSRRTPNSFHQLSE